MNTTPYRAEFSGGPQDGCYLQAEVPLGKRVAAPNRPWIQSIESQDTVCFSTGVPARTLAIRKVGKVAEYWLEWSEYRIENDLPQVVFHYRFHPQCDADRLPFRDRTWKVHRSNWISRQAARFSRWLLAPVDYPLDVRRIGR